MTGWTINMHGRSACRQPHSVRRHHSLCLFLSGHSSSRVTAASYPPAATRPNLPKAQAFQVSP